MRERNGEVETEVNVSRYPLMCRIYAGCMFVFFVLLACDLLKDRSDTTFGTLFFLFVAPFGCIAAWGVMTRRVTLGKDFISASTIFCTEIKRAYDDISDFEVTINERTVVIFKNRPRLWTLAGFWERLLSEFNLSRSSFIVDRWLVKPFCFLAIIQGRSGRPINFTNMPGQMPKGR